MSEGYLEQSTLGWSAPTHAIDGENVVALTVLQHPEVERVGEVSHLFSAATGGVCALSRGQPTFGSTGDGFGRPLASATLSRNPLWIR